MTAGPLLIENRPLPAADSATVRLAAARAVAVADELSRIQAALTGAVPGDGWNGAARLAFAQEMQARASLLAPAIRRYQGFAAALQGYAGQLGVLEPRLRVHPHSAAAPDGGASGDGASLLWEQAWQEWDAARRRCAAALSVAGRIDADRHGLARLWDDIAHGAHEALDHVSLAGLSKALSDLGDVLLVAGLVLSAVFPPAAAVVWGALAVVSVLQLAVDATRCARGEKGVGLVDVAWDAVGVIPAGKVLRGAKSAQECSRLIEKLPAEKRLSRIVPGGLAAHEGPGRGHLLAKHVRKSRRFLQARLNNEPHISMASTFKDRRTAEAAAAWLLRTKDVEVRAWLNNPRGLLDISGDFGHHTGRCLARDGTMVQSTKVRLLLKVDRSTLGYYIKTGHPEP